MLKNGILWVLLCCVSALYGQEVGTPYKTLKALPVQDTITIDTVGINPAYFKLTDKQGIAIDSTLYTVNYTTGRIAFKNGFTQTDSLTVNYLPYPDFLTKKYSIYDPNRVLANDAGGTRFEVTRDALSTYKPFDGLNTSGSITRGVTIGNNQNAVVNSNLDLQITGKLSDKVSLRASIQDSNIPLQDGGYSQKLDEFDQIFIEMFSDKWSVRAGDLFLENRQSRFLNFSKKVQGLSTAFTFGNEDSKTSVFAAAALVRGQYARSTFTGQEGNQGPYKLTGNNGELYVLVISGSERVYVNGILLERGESNDYTIDYNAGEITFTSLFPITSEMRINVEYQYTQQNYTRFVTYGGVTHEEEKWSIGTYLYSEADMKNQPLQQNLSEAQVAALQQAGDDINQMVAPSAYQDTYSENKILYRQTVIEGVTVYEYSNNPDDVLYNVRFTQVGPNLGNYILSNAAAIGRIYQYVAPINGVPQGNYEPVIRLTPPTKIQIATVMGKYNPSEKTVVDFEVGVSNNDLNLYSPIDDDNNNGVAGKIDARQRIVTREKWQMDAFANYQFVQKDFRTIERLFNIEFNRDWNLTNIITTDNSQSYLVAGTVFKLPQNGTVNYQIEKLDFSEAFSGTRHVLNAQVKAGKFTLQNQGSALNSDGTYAKSQFIRNEALGKYHFGKNWVGTSLRLEDNSERLKETNALTLQSQRFIEYGAFIGRGDSTKVYVEVGYLQRANDSLVAGYLKKVNTSRSYYLKSRLLKTDKSDLTVFANYRRLDFDDPSIADEPSLNSRVLYNDRYWDQLVQVTTAYETASGTIAQQEFTYLEVEPGQGVYMWNDYNGNGIQELQEFEVAPFPDQAIYVRVYLPNQVYIGTHQNKFSQSVTLNPMQWQNAGGFKQLLSHFYNTTSYLIDRKILRSGSNFDLNPFSSDDEDLLGINAAFRNSIFYNRGKQNHSVTYTYLSNRTKSLLTVGSQDSKILSHQLQYAYLVAKTWLFSLNSQTTETTTVSDTYASKNYEVEAYLVGPKISYIFSRNASWDVFYEYQDKQNRIGEMETLLQQRVGTSFSYASEKGFTASGEFSLYKNDFTGNQNTAAAYQMLQGLQPGQNTTWRLLLQKNLTQFLDININYQGRKSETSGAIHTGSVQLRAYF
ncbi:hypothetical protein AM493_12395 [Flavobacterium akiainvivens]|uniref:Uncharacterized protein n=1 Tax=Flavobacterium akiainvivens TaxID=1202724 RepID=A0A0M9VIK8_9FLAO|nr:hypothetical protein [Flavobacterium akiainvivens]KOS06739.1 hypothetical protein AM493_12395 [Flavobacterium akiainvivens]SFQ74490.1 hypothetical protein SAMN05444144_12030 [Flavobacterium akiainvivens]